MAKDRDLTVDQMVTEFIYPLPKQQGWSICKACGTKLKTVHIDEHMTKVHSRPLTVKR